MDDPNEKLEKRKAALKKLREQAEEESRQAHQRLERAAEEAHKARQKLHMLEEDTVLGYWHGMPVLTFEGEDEDLVFVDDAPEVLEFLRDRKSVV